MKIMENNVFLPQAPNVSDRMPRKRVPQPARKSFSGYTIDSECAIWEPIGVVQSIYFKIRYDPKQIATESFSTVLYSAII